MARKFGEISGTSVGSIYRTREDLRAAGIHMPMQGGISGTEADGAESIVLSGGYPDDEFSDDYILYTGSGERDKHTDVLIADQEMTGFNLALAKSCDDGLPIRVCRALEARRKRLPKGGYIYEGIFYIESYSQIIGVDGYRIWQFSLIRQSNSESYVYENTAHKRITTTVQRLVRNTLISNSVKKMYDYKCQICNTQIKTPAGFYSEGAHVRPLGANHNGDDNESNILCLCPNHHVMLDYGTIYIDESFFVYNRYNSEKIGELKVNSRHPINVKNFLYQKNIFD